MYKIRSLLEILGVFLVMSCVSCETDPGLCDESVHPHRATMVVKMVWDEKYENRPDTMYFLANRIFNSWKCGMVVSAESDSSDNIVTGRYLFNPPPPIELDDTFEEDDEPDEIIPDSDVPEDDGIELANEEQPDEPSVPDDTPSQDEVEVEIPNYETGSYENPFRILNGTYKMLVFNMDSTQIKYENLDGFLSDNVEDYRTLNDVNIVYRAYALNNDTLKKVSSSWHDYNPYPAGDARRYIQSEMPAVYFDTLTRKGIYMGVLNECEFKPLPLTQRIEVRFTIDKIIEDENGVIKPFKIDSVVAEISGIPHKINLSNGYVDITKTYKMLFRMDVLDINGRPLSSSADSVNAKKLMCRGVIDVTSIVASASPDLFVGPGIMCVRISTSSTVNGYKISKDIPGRINLTHAIKEADLLEYVLDRQTARRKKTHASIVISTPVRINGNVIEETAEGGAVDKWQPCDDIIVDI